MKTRLCLGKRLEPWINACSSYRAIRGKKCPRPICVTSTASRVQLLTSGSKRYDEVGPEGLLDLTRTPHSSPYATSAEIENEVLALLTRSPPWGARKLKARLELVNPDVSWPAASTVGQILSRAALTDPKRKKRRVTPRSQPFSMVTAPIQLWCMDFKGCFLTGDGSHLSARQPLRSHPSSTPILYVQQQSGSLHPA
jgi:hypothetical protein